jgi:hypothetical protein
MLNLNASLRARAWRVNRLNLLPLLTDFSSSAAPDVESGQVRARLLNWDKEGSDARMTSPRRAPVGKNRIYSSKRKRAHSTIK